jgi:HlyD family secretion protein
LFRPEAVSSATGTQETDEPLAVLRSRHLLAGGLLLFGALGGIGWSTQVDVPVKIHGRGILLAPAGVTDLFADGEGRVETLLVQPGDRVAPGQPVAAIDQSDLRLQLRATEGEFADAEMMREELARFHERDTAADSAWRDARDIALGQSLEAAEERRRLTSEREAVMDRLAAQNLISRDRALAARVDLYTVRDTIEQMRNERRSLQLDAAMKRTQREREKLAADQKVAEARRTVASLRERLARVGVVLSPYAGQVVEMKASVGQAITRGAPVLTLSRSEPGKPEIPLVVVYVSAEDGKKLRPGMAAEISPSTTRREEHGFIRGDVEWVADTAASSAGLLRTLQNDQLVRSFTQTLGTPFEVRIRLEADPSGPQGLAWSSGHGPGFSVESGTLAETAVTVRRVRLIALGIPALQRWLSEAL